MSGMSTHGRVEDAVAALDAALDALAGVDLTDVPAASAGEVVVELTRVSRRLQAQTSRAVAALDSSQGFALDGSPSASSWLRAHTQLAPGAARDAVRVARRSAELPTMTESWAAGAISADHLSVVARAMRTTPQRRDTIAQAESTFADAARRMCSRDLSKVVTRWVHTVDPLTAVEAEVAVHAQRSFAVSRTFGGAVVINGLLAPEAGGIVLSALEAMSTADYRASRDVRSATDGSGPMTPGSAGLDERTPTQRRADALVELCRRFLDSGDAPEIAAVRPHVSVLVPLDDLQGRRGGGGELEGIGPISAEGSRRIACDASVTGIGLDPTGMPVSYGRTTRVVPAGLRKLLVARDRGCVFPGCGRPSSWCEAHHLIHWADGGPTDASNLALICIHHHHALHERGFTTRGDPQRGTLTFHRPDGSRIVNIPHRAGHDPGGQSPRAG